MERIWRHGSKSSGGYISLGGHGNRCDGYMCALYYYFRGSVNGFIFDVDGKPT